MIRYVLLRVLRMIPILFGVLLLTFLLFHAVAGSPASLVLGKNAKPQAIEEYNETHGYNLPLICGKWVETLAFRGGDFLTGAGDWDRLPHVMQKGDMVVLPSDMTTPLPLVFPLYQDNRYRLTMEYSSMAPVLLTGVESVSQEALPASVKVRKMSIVFKTGATKELAAPSLTSAAPIHLRMIYLERGVGHAFNSQLWFYVRRLLQGDFGVSSETGEDVLAILRRGAGPSLALNIPILFGTTIMALALALVSAWQRGKWFDRVSVVLATALMSVNYIIWIVGGQYLFAFKLGWFPIWGFESVVYLVLPVLIGIVTGLGRDVRFYRTVMLDEMHQDYVRTAYAKGAGTARVLTRHVLRNAMIPVVTQISMALPFIFTSSLLLESFFGVPGLGSASINAINSSDFAVIQAVVLFGAFFYVCVNLLTDLCYAWVDPRVRLS